MRKSVLLVACFTTLSLLLGGCASSLTGDSYSRDEARLYAATAREGPGLEDQAERPAALAKERRTALHARRLLNRDFGVIGLIQER